MWHRIKHWPGWHTGYVVSGIHKHRGCEWVWIGFRCCECGAVNDYHPSRRLDSDPGTW